MPTKKNLDKLIQEATIDCYDEGECLSGFYTILEENIQFPFPAIVIGEEVEVVGVEWADNGIKAQCHRKHKSYSVNIVDIEYNSNIVLGAEWINAYKKWIGRQ